MKFRNISTSGDLELPLIGRVVRAGETFEISDEQGVSLLEQPAVWQHITKEKAE